MTSDSESKSRLHGYGYALLATLFWAGNFVVARDLRDCLPPVALSVGRWAVAVAFALPFVGRSLWRERSLLRRHLGYLALCASLGVSFFTILIYLAARTSTAVNLSLISITFPVFVVLFARLFWREAIGGKRAAGILLVLGGVVLLISGGRPAELLRLSFNPGDGWMLLAAVLFAVYSMLVKRVPKGISTWSFQGATFSLGLLFLLPAWVWEMSGDGEIILNGRVVIGLLYAGIFTSALAFLLWQVSVERLGASDAGMMYYTLPLFSALMGAVFLAEGLTGLHGICAALILGGIFLANFKTQRPEGA